jgi:hypothetical protein
VCSARATVTEFDAVVQKRQPMVRCEADYGRRDVTGWKLPVDSNGHTQY